MTGISRRDLIKAGMASAAVALPGVQPANAQAPQTAAPDMNMTAHAAAPSAPEKPSVESLFFFNSEEAKFIDAAIARLIPGDGRAGGAREAGVLYYIDQQLAGAYGAGARMYLKGPWQPDAPPQQGYQLRHSPAELYRFGIAESREYVSGRFGRKEVWDLAEADLDAVLGDLETGAAQLRSIAAPMFFETLLANTIEGYFADPAYGGNRDMVSWRLVGFPGAYAQYVELVDEFGFHFSRPPIGIGTAAGDHDLSHS